MAGNRPPPKIPMSFMKKKFEQTPSICPECGSRNLIRDKESGEIVCGECGLVISESTLNTEPEWRSFTLREHNKRSRVGLPTSLSMYDKGLSTKIGSIYKDGKGRRITQEARRGLLRLKSWQKRSTVSNSEEKNLLYAMRELVGLTDRLYTPRRVIEQAAAIYRRALKKDITRGRSIAIVMAASLYMAYRITKTPTTLREIASKGPVETKKVARCYRLLLKELKIKMPVPKAQFRVPRVASKAEIGEECQRRAVDILGEADRLKITFGKDPMGLAAAALYLACVMIGDKCTQKVIAAASGVTEVTIRNRYKELERSLDMDRFKQLSED